jgi:hypothetical protein
MSTRLTKKLTYEASAEAVAAMLDDVAFREEVLRRQKVDQGSATVEGDVVTIEQRRSSAGLPGFAQKIVGDQITIVQRETWTSPTTCDVELSIPGKPGEAVGTMRLEESGGTTTEVVDLDLSVRVPLVGGKIESLVAAMFGEALDIEQAVGREWLARG